MARVGNDDELGFGPGAMQIPAAGDRTAGVVTAMDDDGGKMADSADVFDQIIIGLEKAIVHEIMALDPGERQSHARFRELIDQRLIGDEL